MKTCRRLCKHRMLDLLQEAEATEKRSVINTAAEAFEILKEALELRIQELDKELEGKALFDSPAYTYKVADLIGSKRELRNVISLISETEE